MTVISLAKAREEREPHWAGKCICLGCRHEWVGVGPVGVTTGLQCPECDLPKGVTKNLFGSDEGDPTLVCNCGCEALTAYKNGAHLYVRCMACGNNLTHAFWGDE